VKLSIGIYFLLASSTTSTVALAENDPATPGGANASSGPGLQEIVVTAQRREQRLQDVPITVTAVTGAGLEKAGVTNTVELTQMVPNLTFTSAGVDYQATIRGVGTRGVTQGDESNVATYIDGVYVPDEVAADINFLKVQRVEVLSGPQGTLFGRNATGGLINIITADPSFTPSQEVSFTYGNLNERDASAYMTGGITDQVAVDLALSSQKNDGYVRNIFRNVEENPLDSEAVRAKLLYTPSDSARIVLAASYSFFSDPTPEAYSPLDGNFSARARDPNVLIPGVWQVSTNLPTENQSHNAMVYLLTELKFDWFTLNTVTSYQDFMDHYLNDNDGSQLQISYLNVTSETRTGTQEIRFNSNSKGPLQWVAGLYGFDSHPGYKPLILNGTAQVNTKQETVSGAAFADVTFRITPRFDAIAGIRYTYESRDQNFLESLLPSGTIPPGDRIVASAHFSETTPRAILQYHYSDTGMTYISYDRGFKSGVFNASAAVATPVKPEVLDAYEVGIKDDPLPWLRTNFDVFYYNYKNIQESAVNGLTGQVALLNAADSHIKGAEAELTADVTPELSFQLNLSYLDAKYTSFPEGVAYYPLPQGGNLQVNGVNLSGRDMIRAPRYTISFGPKYEHPFGNSWLAASANVYSTAKYYWDFQNRLTVPAYTQFNTRLSWTFPNKTTTLALFGRNLTNAAVPQNLLPSATIDDVTYQPPRTYGVTFTQKF
jgi:iron complex outermembrane receptor protein